MKNRTFHDHRDKWDLLTFRLWREGQDYEGGDTAHREGMWHAGEAWQIKHYYNYFKIRDSFYESVIKHLKHPTKKGIWRRHPDERYWYGDWDRMSRDQSHMIVHAMGALDLEEELNEFFRALAFRGSFMTNTRANGTYPKDHKLYHPDSKRVWKWKLPDFCGPSFWNYLWRSKLSNNSWKVWLWIPILIGDLQTLFESLNKVLFYGKDPGNFDDPNHIGVLVYGQRLKETFIHKWARRIYFKYRPMANDPILKEYEVTNGPQSALRAYFDPMRWEGLGASPPHDRQWESLVSSLGD